jgi:hypothetical protein
MAARRGGGGRTEARSAGSKCRFHAAPARARGPYRAHATSRRSGTQAGRRAPRHGAADRQPGSASPLPNFRGPSPVCLRTSEVRSLWAEIERVNEVRGRLLCHRLAAAVCGGGVIVSVEDSHVRSRALPLQCSCPSAIRRPFRPRILRRHGLTDGCYAVIVERCPAVTQVRPEMPTRLCPWRAARQPSHPAPSAPARAQPTSPGTTDQEPGTITPGEVKSCVPFSWPSQQRPRRAHFPWPKGLAGGILRSHAVERVGFKIL